MESEENICACDKTLATAEHKLLHLKHYLSGVGAIQPRPLGRLEQFGENNLSNSAVNTGGAGPIRTYPEIYRIGRD